MDIIQVLTVWLVIAAAYWRRDIFLYLLSCPVALVFGFTWYSTYLTPLAMVVALAMAAIGGYSLLMAIRMLVGR